MTIEHNPWDRRPGEGSKAFDAFAKYRDAGPTRSMRKLVDAFPDYSFSQVARWSSANGWQSRVDAWDAHVDLEAQVESLEQQKRMRRNHAAVGGLGVAKAAEFIRMIDPGKMTVRDAVSLLDVSSKLQRAALGDAPMPTSSSAEEEERADPGMAGLAELRDLLSKIPRVNDVARLQ